MRAWIDLANSPHVPLLEPVVQNLRNDGHEVLLTVRDHAQTLELARQLWPDAELIGGESPGSRLAKGRQIAARAVALARYARRTRPDVAFSHGSYAQLIAARAARVPAATMMDYEHQPANHLSFRLAKRVVVPELFPAQALRRFGARDTRVRRYPGFKEQLYLADFTPDHRVLDGLGLDVTNVLVVMRPAPEGALYHQMTNSRFDEIVAAAAGAEGVQVVLLPRSAAQAHRYGEFEGVQVPGRAIDARSLLALADVAVGAGGTMNRESALLGTPTYTAFAARLAAVDSELMRLGLLHDLRDPGVEPRFVKKDPELSPSQRGTPERIMATIREAVIGLG
jgi:predicted glycosyltransferase